MFCNNGVFKIFAKFSGNIRVFLISNTFISNPRLKLAKNQAKANHRRKAELSLFANYWLSSSMLSSKSNRHSKQRTKISGLFNWGYIINKKNETENKKWITDTTEMDLGLSGCTFEIRQGGLKLTPKFWLLKKIKLTQNLKSVSINLTLTPKQIFRFLIRL